MRVLVVMTARQIGGAELYVRQLVGALRGRCNFTVAISDHPAMAPLRDELAGMAQVVALQFDRAQALAGVSQTVRGLADRHDVAHLVSNHPGSRLGILMGFALGGARTPYVVVEQRATRMDDVKVPAALKGALPAAFRRSRRRAARVIAVSEENRRTLIGDYGLPPDQIVVIHNGVEVERFAGPGDDGLRRELGLDAGTQVVLTVASLVPNKGHHILIEAAPAVLSRYPGVRFVLAGEGASRANIETQIAAAGLMEHFSLIGFRDDPAYLLMGSDLFVLPSLAEGFSLALVEALAAGLPTVATAVGGAPEVIEDGRNGFLIPPEDASALAGALIRALGLPEEERAAMAAEARQTAQRYSVEAMAERTLELYEAVCAGGRHAGGEHAGGEHAGSPLRGG